MREANKAILCTQFIKELNGAKLFSKIDLRSGYHQLELHPSSHYNTRFSTHIGLYRYKRLSFGINAAVEIFQHEIRTVIEDIPGAITLPVLARPTHSQVMHSAKVTEMLVKLMISNSQLYIHTWKRHKMQEKKIRWHILQSTIAARFSLTMKR